jgi:hypothetical protein
MLGFDAVTDGVLNLAYLLERRSPSALSFGNWAPGFDVVSDGVLLPPGTLERRSFNGSASGN